MGVWAQVRIVDKLVMGVVSTCVTLPVPENMKHESKFVINLNHEELPIWSYHSNDSFFKSPICENEN